MKLRVVNRKPLTPEVLEFTLVCADGGSLPAMGPGAHITLETPSGARRRYSLVHTGPDLDTYTIAIKREPLSRGGSESMHTQAQIGVELDAQPPENQFPLDTTRPALLIAGGIGITPIYSMARSLESQKLGYRLIYCAREEELAPYLSELKRLCGDKLTTHFDQGDRALLFDFWDLLAEPTSENIYCCGPNPLMEEVKGVTGHWPEGRVHFEEFKPIESVRANDQAFDIELVRSKQTIHVKASQTILEAMREHGLPVVSSCESGTCGTCKCTYVEGDVDHRDLVLMDEEKGFLIMPCVSRAKGTHLVLDL
jgi:phthalate 4,5-dioxygenase reductase subunit